MATPAARPAHLAPSALDGRVQQAENGTCYAHATARVMLEAWLRVLGVSVPSYQALVSAIIHKFGIDGASPKDVIEYFGNTTERMRDEAFRRVYLPEQRTTSEVTHRSRDGGSVVMSFTFSRSRFYDYAHLPPLHLTKIAAGSVSDHLQRHRRPLLLAFWLTEPQWSAFHAYVRGDQRHLPMPEGTLRAAGMQEAHGGGEGRAVVVYADRSTRGNLCCKDSWAGWGVGGTFAVSSVEALQGPPRAAGNPYALDVYWYENELHPLCRLERFPEVPGLMSVDLVVGALADDIIHRDAKTRTLIRKGTYRGEAVAIKTIPAASVHNELLFRFEHPHLLRTIGHCPEELPEDCQPQTTTGTGSVHMVVELADGTLSDLRDVLTDAEVTRAVHHMLLALQHLHSLGVTHRDVQPQNIFRVGDAWKLGGFGMALRDGTNVPTVNPLTDMWFVAELLCPAAGNAFTAISEEARAAVGIDRAVLESMRHADVTRRPSAAHVAAVMQCRKNDAVHVTLASLMKLMPTTAASQLLSRIATLFPEEASTVERLVERLAAEATSSPQTVTLLCQAVADLAQRSPSHQLLLGTPPFRDPLVSLAQHATTPESACWLSKAICNLTSDNFTNQQLFGTAAVRDALVGLAPLATTAEGVQDLCHVLWNLSVTDDNRQVFGTVAVHNALVAVAPRATTAESVQHLCNALWNLALSDTNKQLFGTTAVREVLTALAPRATSAESVEQLCGVLRTLTANDNGRNQQIFGTAAVRDALVALTPRATTADSVEQLCGALLSLSANDIGQQLFGTVVVRDMLTALAPRATTSGSVEQFCGALLNLATTGRSQQLFGTAAVRDAVVALAPRATTAESAQKLCGALCHLALSDSNQQLFGAGVRDALIELCSAPPEATRLLSILTADGFPASISANPSSSSTSSTSLSRRTTRDDQVFVDELTCSICFEVLDKPLVATPCLHSFCTRCLVASKPTGGTTSHRCPICRTPVSGMQTMHLLSTLVEALLARHPDLKRVESNETPR